MKGYQIIALTEDATTILREKYGKPGVGDRMLAKVNQVNESPLTYDVIFKHKIGSIIDTQWPMLIDRVFESFAKEMKITKKTARKKFAITIIR